LVTGQAIRGLVDLSLGGVGADEPARIYMDMGSEALGGQKVGAPKSLKAASEFWGCLYT